MEFRARALKNCWKAGEGTASAELVQGSQGVVLCLNLQTLSLGGIKRQPFPEPVSYQAEGRFMGVHESSTTVRWIQAVHQICYSLKYTIASGADRHMETSHDIQNVKRFADDMVAMVAFPSAGQRAAAHSGTAGDHPPGARSEPAQQDGAPLDPGQKPPLMPLFHAP